MPDFALRYPIGKYVSQPFSLQQKNDWLNDLRFLPGSIEQAILNLDEAQLETPYREGGWTVKQLIHHIGDSHLNAYCRFKWALTESIPVIKTYDEKRWATLDDCKKLPVNVSITLLHALHLRWVSALEDIPDQAWKRKLFHPEHMEVTLWNLLGMYAWHGRHHLAHITGLRERNGW